MAHHVLSTSRFERDYKALAKRNPRVISQVEAMVGVLRQDPHNRTGQHNIRKLRGVKAGEGQWRIALGDYRIRYDIFGQEKAVMGQEIVTRGNCGFGSSWERKSPRNLPCCRRLCWIEALPTGCWALVTIS